MAISPSTRRTFLKSTGLALAAASAAQAQSAAQRPNIVWIVAEDASPHLGCFGETTIKTPNLDALAAQGIRFDAAYVTCPVCSPSRSAMVTGMYQPTLGAHNHRSQCDDGKGAGGPEYMDSYRLPVKLIPELFREAGYYTALGKGPNCDVMGKTDYNFLWDRAAYDGPAWRGAPAGKPFFAQIMLGGGKNRGAKKHATDPAKVTLPPYYPDHPVLREDWADYLNSWVQQDVEVAEIMKGLKDAGVLDNTVVFYWTDHGVSHLRGKQFNYEEGAHVPLIVRLPGGRGAGTVRDDLVVQIDVAAASLALAGIPIPENVQGRDILAADYRPRDAVFSARDRCDETPDIIRSVHTKRFKYIRNFLAHCAHMQPNQYKYGKQIVKTMFALHEEGKLNELQARVFAPTRPPEELYDLQEDPHETVNLAGDAAHADTLAEIREKLYAWLEESRDVGLIPEPVLEEWGKEWGNKYYILQRMPGKEDLLRKWIIPAIEAGERGDEQELLTLLAHGNAAVQYWAATGLGNLGAQHHNDTPDKLHAKLALSDKTGKDQHAVRVASALALCKLGKPEKAIPVLIEEIDSPNYIVGIYAIRALEIAKADTPEVRQAVAKAKDHPYEFTMRIALRLSGKFPQSG